MIKGLGKIFAISVIMASTISAFPVTHANADSSNTSITFQNVSEFKLNERYEEIMDNPRLIKERTVDVDVQGKKINDSTAKINYIRYSNSGFKSPSKGAHLTNIFEQGNPAKGHIYTSFVCYDSGDYFTGNSTILVQAYPSGNLTIR